MSRPKPNKSRVTPKKKPDATSGSKKGSPKVELKTRDAEQRNQDFETLVEHQPTPEQEPQVPLTEDPVTEFLYNGKTFKFTDIDADVTSALEGYTVFSSAQEASGRLLKLVFISPEEHARFVKELNNDIEQVLANRKAWKAAGKDPEDEPIGVAEFMNTVVRDVLKLFMGSINIDPKGRG